jgi:hypothetical protein
LALCGKCTRHPGIHNIVGVECEALKNDNPAPFKATLLGYTHLKPREVQETAALILQTFGCHHMIFRFHHKIRELWLSSILWEKRAQPSIITPKQFISLEYNTVYCCHGDRTQMSFWNRKDWIHGVVGQVRSVGFRGRGFVESAWGLEQGIEHKDLKSEDEVIQSLATATLTEALAAAFCRPPLTKQN